MPEFSTPELSPLESVRQNGSRDEHNARECGISPQDFNTVSDFRRSRYLAYLALGVGIFSLGFSGIFVRWADAPGIVTSFYRMAIAAALSTLLFRREHKKIGRLPPGAVRAAVLGGLFFSADLAFWATGVTLSGATNPTLLANIAPLWVGLGALFFFQEKLRHQFWAGLFTAMVGATIVLGLDTQQAAAQGLGTLFGLIASLFYGAYFLVTQRGRATLPTITYFWLSSVSSTFGLLILALVFRLPLTGYPLKTYLSFIAVGLVTQVLGYLAINYALGQLPATIVSPTMLGQPVVTALLARPLLGEAFHLWQVLGAVGVLVGVYLVHQSRLNKPKRVLT